jgi:hypothetical protein
LEPLDFDEVLYGGDAIEGDHYVVIFSPTASIVLKWLQFKFVMHHNKGFMLVCFQDISYHQYRTWNDDSIDCMASIWYYLYKGEKWEECKFPVRSKIIMNNHPIQKVSHFWYLESDVSYKKIIT